MVNAHEAAATAQIVFYAPIVPVAFYIGIRAWKFGPRTAWYYPMPFTLVRLVGGCLVLATEHDPQNLGLLITTIVLLNVGLIPLLFSYHRLVRMM
ncbi:hypothetical protein jhhlp_006634 [Lomentospora prolificans]|uniref:DUF7702 domain-containing protein n=1 Tax=Lomentospora prolificans TaxID=41688 RepID=A0A2N3N6L9_9PEZI|nr:hypothetical protein jhhlp_006634 [Lomentospora prolificans]